MPALRKELEFFGWRPVVHKLPKLQDKRQNQTLKRTDRRTKKSNRQNPGKRERRGERERMSFDYRTLKLVPWVIAFIGIMTVIEQGYYGKIGSETMSAGALVFIFGLVIGLVCLLPKQEAEGK